MPVVTDYDAISMSSSQSSQKSSDSSLGVRGQSFMQSVRSLHLITVGIYSFIYYVIRLRWYGHVLQKDDNDWVKECMEYEVVAPDPEVGRRAHG